VNAGSERKIDGRQVRALVRAFIAMSLRTMPIRTMRGERKGGGAGSLYLILGVLVFLGAALGLMAKMTGEVLVYSFVLHMMTLFFVGTSAMSEASEVLFTTSENDVLMHRPIHPATLVLAKAITILAFTLLLALALNLVPMFTIAIVGDARPAAPLAHLASVVVSTVFASATVICLYGLVARFLGRTRLQRLVTAAQIGSTVFLAFGFQLVPRLLDVRSGFDLTALLHASKWCWFLPPAWFAALDAWLGAKTADPRLMPLALLGLGVTACLAWLGVLRLPTTGTNAASIQEETRKDVAVRETARGPGLLGRLLAPWLRDPIERASFMLAKAYLARERGVKVRLASALAVYVVFPLIAIADSRRSGFVPVMLFWMTALVPFTVIESLRISPNPAAADLFLYSPIAGGARVFHGVRKAAIVLVQVPLAAYIAVVAAFVLRHEPAQLLLALPALLLFPTFSLAPGLLDAYLPLSMPSRTGQRSTQTLLVLLIMLPAGVLAFVAHLAQAAGLLWVMLAVEAPLVVAVHLLLLRFIDRRMSGPIRHKRSAESGSLSAPA
jgi:hypothetical protein